MYLDEFTIRKLHETRLHDYQQRQEKDKLVRYARKAKEQLKLYAPLRKRR